MSIEKKQAFIDLTYRILKEEGPDGIKIRRIASELNCTSTVIYRYFDDLDHLTALASMRFFTEYIEDFRILVSDPQVLTDPYGLNLRMWECLGRHAFNNIPIYEKLFFGKYKNSLGEVIFEYYQLFLDPNRSDFDGYSASILFNDDIFQRDYVLLRRAAAIGTITPQDAELLSQMECHIFRGILLKYMDSYKQPGVPQKATKEFMTMLYDLAARYQRKN